MQRGIINFTNNEINYLYNLLNKNNLIPQDLITKLSPVLNNEILNQEKSNQYGSSQVDSNQEAAKLINVLVSEEEVEIILDNLPISSIDDSPELLSSRLKSQQFLAKIRFPESFS